jgi:hypothetical protein
MQCYFLAEYLEKIPSQIFLRKKLRTTISCVKLIEAKITFKTELDLLLEKI